MIFICSYIAFVHSSTRFAKGKSIVADIVRNVSITMN